MYFWGIRHGQSEYNLKNLCNDDVSKKVKLTEYGIEQAQMVAQELASHNISQIICSPLTRTVQTAEIISRRLSKPLFKEMRLCDIHTGFDGRAVDDYLSFISKDPLNTKMDGYESLSDHFHRVSQFLDELKSKKETNLLLVAHEETMRVFKAWSENLDLKDVVGMSFENCKPFYFQKRHDK